MAALKPDRLFNSQPWRHYRRRYSLGEVKATLLIAALLALIAGWVVWKGAHPDPELFAMRDSLLEPGSTAAPPRAKPLNAATETGEPAPAVLGPVPRELAAPGWRQAAWSVFDRDNLYEKINGRAGYYESFGVQRLYYVSLAGDRDASASVDIELYDLGSVANALGAYAGERSPAARPELLAGSLGHLDRNALYMVRGRYYLRAIGSDESPRVLDQLAHARRVFSQSLPADPLPWSYSLFVVKLGLEPAGVAYYPQDAFSFGFAERVWAAQIDGQGAELFVVATPHEAAAQALATRFVHGFLSYGDEGKRDRHGRWVVDHYLGTVSGVGAVRSMVMGVRGAAELASGRRQLARLADAVASLSRAELAAAAGAAPPGDASTLEAAGHRPAADREPREEEIDR